MAPATLWIAYLANRFADPNLTKFFATRDVSVDSNTIALSEMLQWIWRSAIRDGQPINLYVPSRRMRKLLTDWIEKVKRGGPVDGYPTGLYTVYVGSLVYGGYFTMITDAINGWITSNLS